MKGENSKVAVKQGKAVVRGIHVPPRKARLVADMIRGKHVAHAERILSFSTQKSAKVLLKALKSALANARENAGADVDHLWVESVSVDRGATMFRYMPAAHGRANPIKKRTSHFNVQLSEKLA